MKKIKDAHKSIIMLCAFLLWTVLVKTVDVKPLGPENSAVGFSSLNKLVNTLLGTNITLYNITDWLSLIPVAFIFGFALLGLVQLIRRRNILKVDFSILILGLFYIVVLAFYLFFENCVINYRPVLINGFLEASYPSSTTLLVLCVMPTASMQLKERIKNIRIKRIIYVAISAFTAFMVVCRLISGVHWFSDIVGGGFLSAGLVLAYRAIMVNESRNLQVST